MDLCRLNLSAPFVPALRWIYVALLEVQGKQLEEGVSGQQLCQICGGVVGVSANGGIFVACNECGFPFCLPCYDSTNARKGTSDVPGARLDTRG